MKYRKFIYLGLIIICFVSISFFSSADSKESNKTSKELIKKVITAYENITDKKLDKKDLVYKLNPVVRKIAHFTLFFILGITVILFIDSIGVVNKKVLISILICLIIALIDETHQLFTSGRTGRIFDIFVDTAGSICAILLIKSLQFKKNLI